MITTILLNHRLGMKRTKIKPINPRPIRPTLHQLPNPLMHAINIRLAVLAPRHPTLVRHHDHLVAQPAQRRDRRGRTLDQLHLLRVAQIAIIANDGVVPIKKNRRLHVH
jgi:hypothetical protein